jgi:hypothetical protein
MGAFFLALVTLERCQRCPFSGLARFANLSGGRTALGLGLVDGGLGDGSSLDRGGFFLVHLGDALGGAGGLDDGCHSSEVFVCMTEEWCFKSRGSWVVVRRQLVFPSRW